jgi:hypothetical protein
MPPERGFVLPRRWLEFLKEVDHALSQPTGLHCLGGFVLAAAYGLPRPTADLDYISVQPVEIRASLEAVAGRGSALAREYGLYFQYVTVADVPEDYPERLTPLLPGQFLHLRLLALEVHDLMLAKLVRNSPVDLEDAKFLARTGHLDPAKLRERYQREMRPNLSNEARHDLTLKIWLDACFGQ